MTRCEELSDLMPEVAAGTLNWSEEQRLHLAACADCGQEWRLVSATRHFGDDLVASLDPSSISAAVLVRLAQDRRSARSRRNWLGGLAIAASISVLIWTGAGSRGHAPLTGPATTQVASQLTLPMAELDSLDTTQLQSVLEGLDQPLGAVASPTVPSLGDLNDLELERVLRSLEA
ncbi:MAG: hypothetical protein ABJD11_15245 [Gemmatimonadota bacterium]